MSDTLGATNAPNESVILCEGYYERTFLAGWLLWRGCTDPGANPGKQERQLIRDPWKEPVSHGEYAFKSPNGSFIRVIPCMGSGNILNVARTRLNRRATRALTRLALCYDADSDLTDTSPSVDSAHHQGENLSQEFDGAPENGVWRLGGTQLLMVCWHANDPPSSGLPERQTLERLLRPAMVEAYPPRGESVRGWLDGRHEAPEAGPKHFSWSYFAGWYAHHGAEDFYRLIWSDELIANQIETRLRMVEGWTQMEDLARL